jgi:hypothetical protein
LREFFLKTETMSVLKPLGYKSPLCLDKDKTSSRLTTEATRFAAAMIPRYAKAEAAKICPAPKHVQGFPIEAHARTQQKCRLIRSCVRIDADASAGVGGDGQLVIWLTPNIE